MAGYVVTAHPASAHRLIVGSRWAGFASSSSISDVSRRTRLLVGSPEIMTRDSVVLHDVHGPGAWLERLVTVGDVATECGVVACRQINQRLRRPSTKFPAATTMCSTPPGMCGSAVRTEPAPWRSCIEVASCVRAAGREQGGRELRPFGVDRGAPRADHPDLRCRWVDKLAKRNAQGHAE